MNPEIAVQNVKQKITLSKNKPGCTTSTGFRASFCKVDHSILLNSDDNFKYFWITWRYKHLLAKYR